MTMGTITDCHLDQAEALLAILGREHAALLSGDLAAIEAIVREKQTAAAELEALARLALDARELHDARGTRLLELARACRSQNEINGGMVEAGLRHTRRVLALLHGQNPDDEVYARTGGSVSPSRARPLATA